MINIRYSAFSRFVSDIKDARPDSNFYYIYTNLRVVYNESPELAKALIQTSTMEGDEIWKTHGVAWFVPKFDHPFARMSAYITTLRSVVDELVRERVQSDAVESTRWCDYSNEGRFDGISFCLPHWVEDSTFNACFKRFLKDVEAIEKMKIRFNVFTILKILLFAYIKMILILQISELIIISDVASWMRSFIMKLKMNLIYLLKMHVSICS